MIECGGKSLHKGATSSFSSCGINFSWVVGFGGSGKRWSILWLPTASHDGEVSLITLKLAVVLSPSGDFMAGEFSEPLASISCLHPKVPPERTAMSI
jgi:hypothetical protein